MTIQELYLKTLFCCMACDGDIADEEVDLVRKVSKNTNLLDGLDVESKLNEYIAGINAGGAHFLHSYIKSIIAEELSEEQQMTIVDLALQMIYADNIVQYSEVKFFKKIRKRLSLTDEQILAKHPDEEDFLLPDVDVLEIPEWGDVTFANISMAL